jgi:hypothetical protein
MTTLTVELPEPLTQQLQNSGLSPRQVEGLIIRLIDLYLHQQEVRATVNLFEQAAPVESGEPELTKPRRRAGRAKHLNIQMSDDFDEPLEDFAEYME